MTETGVVQETTDLSTSNDNTSDVQSEPPTASISSENSQQFTDENPRNSNQNRTDGYIIEDSRQSQNQSNAEIHNAMSRLSIRQPRPRSSSRFYRNVNYNPHHIPPPRHSQYRRSMPRYYPNMNEQEAHAQLAAFTPSLMSLSIHPQDESNSYLPQPQSLLSKNKTESIQQQQPEYYVDSFAPTFANKPVSNGNNNNNNKTKIKHVTFQEPEIVDEQPKSDEHFVTYPQQSNGFDYPPSMYSYAFHPNYRSSYRGGMTRPRYFRGMNMMPIDPSWMSSSYYYNQPIYFPPSPQYRQLYDPNKPKVSTTSESFDTSANVIRSIVPKNKKKIKRMIENESTTESETPPSEQPVQPPITILRKPSNDVSCSSSSISSHELLSILQSANFLSSFNEYVQQKKFILKYDFTSISSSSSSSSFSCIITLDGRQFDASPSFSSKNEAQKSACDQILRILYREACNREQSSIEFSSKHDLIAHRSISTFHDLNVNESLLGRKTLACILMTIDEQIDQARVISIGTGNSCLAESNLMCTNDGSVLHDCHAEILARRGLIRYLFEELKQIKINNNSSSIFEFNSITNKYFLRSNIQFHMYISSLPCGILSTNIPTNSIRYKQDNAEGTLLASTINYPIKSCSDKICRWNILGIQGGLLISLLDKPIYLQTFTLACEINFNYERIKNLFSQRFNEQNILLPFPFLFHLPDINYPKIKSFQQERQVARLQTNAFAWNITQKNQTELLEPMTGRLKTDRSVSSLSKQRFFEDFIELIQINNNNSLPFSTYQQAKQLDKNYVNVKNLISAAFEAESPGISVPWSSKSDQLEQFTFSPK